MKLPDLELFGTLGDSVKNKYREWKGNFMFKGQTGIVTFGSVLTACSVSVLGESANLPVSNFHRSLQNESIHATTPFSEADVTKEYLYRTVEDNAPVLDIDIPETVNRVDGPRITVRAFEFHRLQDFPEYGIHKQDVERLAESLRIKYMKEDQIFSSGYTRENLEELAGYLDRIGARNSVANLDAENVKNLVELIKKQNEERGMSYGDLESIAQEITAFYRQNGLFLAQVQIPAQDVENGVVKLAIQEGRLGKVVVDNNKKYQTALLSNPFEEGVGSLVSHGDMEEALYLLNDLPGLNVTGYFTAGDAPGETAMNLQVRKEDGWKIAVRSDNHGSRFTGDKRGYVVGELLNPTGYGDRLTFGYLKSTDPGNTELMQTSYSIPLFSPRTQLVLSAERNEFELDDDEDVNSVINQLDLEGTNESYAVGLEHKFVRSRDFNISTGIRFTEKKTEVNSVDSVYDQEEHVYGGELNFYIDGLSDSIRMFNVANLGLSYGEHQTDVPEERGDEFYKLSLDTHSLFFVPLPFANAESRFVLKSRWQYSEQLMPSFEQMSLGGASGVRGFSVRDFSSDQGAMINAEWYFDVPHLMNFEIYDGRYLNDVLQFGIIADAAYGNLVNFEDGLDDSWAYLSSFGFITKWSWDEFITSQITFSKPSSSKSSVEGIGDDAESIEIYADLTIQF